LPQSFSPLSIVKHDSTASLGFSYATGATAMPLLQPHQSGSCLIISKHIQGALNIQVKSAHTALPTPIPKTDEDINNSEESDWDPTEITKNTLPKGFCDQHRSARTARAMRFAP
jgi:hypothetical protein